MARLRLKNRWFKAGAAHPPQQVGEAMAFAVWRVAHNALVQMRGAGFDVEVGEPYFAFLREWLVFLVQALDRMAYDRLAPEDRTAFTTALVQRVALHLAENEARLLQPEAPASAADRFVDLVNRLAPEYGDFGHDAGGPGFGFMRYLGHRIEPLLPEKDRHWVVDQVVAVEAPGAVQLLARSFEGLLANEPRAPRRGVLSGD